MSFTNECSRCFSSVVGCPFQYSSSVFYTMCESCLAVCIPHYPALAPWGTYWTGLLATSKVYAFNRLNADFLRYSPNFPPYGRYEHKRLPGSLLATNPYVGLVDKVYPISDIELASLRLVAEGKGWKVDTARIENLIQAGYLDCMGLRLTESGKKELARGTNGTVSGTVDSSGSSTPRSFPY